MEEWRERIKWKREGMEKVLTLDCTHDSHPRMSAVPTVMMVPSGVVREGSLLK